MNNTQKLFRYEFGEWVIEPHLNRICRDGNEIQLEHRAVEVLRYLLDHAGKVVSLDELLDSVWENRVVEPNVIHRNVSRIRHALGDNPHEPRYIETISKRGYRTIAPVTKTEAVQVEPASDIMVSKRPGMRAIVVVAAVCLLGILSVWLLNSRGSNTLDVPAASTNVPTSVAQAYVNEPAPNSIAVLPFESLSPNQADEYFAAGIHEEVINRLFKINDLLVIARPSVLGFAESSKPIREIASELGVRTVLMGSVWYANDRVRIRAQLLDAQTGSQLWSQSYDRDLDDVFEIQDEIATNIATQLSVALAGELPQSQARNPQAYLLYLQARHLLGLSDADVDRILRAEKLLNSALQLDPSDITVMMELARLYLQKEQVGLVSAGDTRDMRRNMMLAALAIDPDHSVANAWLGWHSMYDDGDWEKAGRQYERATALDPRNVNIIRGAVQVMLQFGRISDAKVLGEYLVKHDPLCVICLMNVASVHLAMGQFYAAIGTSRSVLAMAPQNHQAKVTLGISLLLNEQTQAALSVFEQLETSNRRMLLVSLAQYDLNQQVDFTASITNLIGQRPIDPLAVATAYAWSDDLDEAFVWLDKAVQQSIGGQLSGIYAGPHDPLLQNLKSDPRWLSYLEKIGRAPSQLDRYKFEITLPE